MRRSGGAAHWGALTPPHTHSSTLEAPGVGRAKPSPGQGETLGRLLQAPGALGSALRPDLSGAAHKGGVMGGSGGRRWQKPRFP